MVKTTGEKKSPKRKMRKLGKKEQAKAEVRALKKAATVHKAALMALLDKLNLSNAQVHDHPHLIVVTQTDNPPFVINLLKGTIEDIDVASTKVTDEPESGQGQSAA